MGSCRRPAVLDDAIEEKCRIEDAEWRRTGDRRTGHGSRLRPQISLAQ
jgi:hypothetical protein